MLDQLRREIEARLDVLLGEAEKLRHALAALGSRGGAAPPAAAPAGRRVRSAPASRKSARPRPSASSPSAQPAQVRASAPAARRRSGTAARATPGATKTAVLQALSGGEAMTAGEVASATGLGRGTVNTTLSRLAKSGQVTKAARGYQLTGPAPQGAPAATAGNAENGQPGG